MNWLDIIILLVIAYSAYQGTRSGFLVGLSELGGIVISLAVPFLLCAPLGRLAARHGVSPVYADALAFIAIWLVAVSVYFWAVRRWYKRVPEGVRMSTVNRLLGAPTGAIKGIVVSAMLLTLAVALPNRLLGRSSLDGSRFAPPMLDATMAVSAKAESIFGQSLHNALGFLTIEPKSDERVILHLSVAHPMLDPKAESAMLSLLNAERTSRGLKRLVVDPKLRNAARAHSIDMLKHGYFSHDSLDGRTPFDRMRKAGVRFTLAGENIAFAPTVRIAHVGLMKSPGHRANILNRGFGRVGIGIARDGAYRAMFTQDFAN